MAYRYTVFTPDKRIMRGVIDAESESMAEEALYRAGHERVLSLAEIGPGLSLERLLPSFFGVRLQDVVDFSQQLATLLESGVGVITALQLLEGQAARAALKRVIAGLVEELEGGSLLSQALGKYPQAFSETYCQIIRASEETGSLEVGLRQIAGYIEKRMETKKKLIRAAAYPVMVLLMAAGVVALLVTVVLPPLVRLFTSLGAELPWITGLFVVIASFLVNYGLYLLGAGCALAVLIVGYVRLPAGKLTVDRLMLKIPIIGTTNIERDMGYLCQTTSMLLKAGVLLPQIMSIVIEGTRNRIIRQALREVREGLVQGEGLSVPMAANELFPRLLVEMVLVGEKTGNMEVTLDALAHYYQQRVDQRVDTLTSMIEPALTVAIGVVVAFVALSIVTPLYSILRSV